MTSNPKPAQSAGATAQPEVASAEDTVSGEVPERILTLAQDLQLALDRRKVAEGNGGPAGPVQSGGGSTIQGRETLVQR